MGFNGTSSKPVGTAMVRTQVGEWEKNITYKVVEGRTQLILGYLGLNKFGF